MTLVALEASTRRGSVAARSAERTASVVLDGERAHASDLLPAVECALAELGAAPRDLTAVVVGTGPGSFTGLRVTIATAMGLARGTGALVRGVPSIEAMLFAELAPGEEACVVQDARAGELYFAHHRRTEDDVTAISRPRVVAVGVPLEAPRGARLFGDEAGLALAGLEGDATRVPTATDVLELGAARLARLGGEDPSSIEPLYLRAFAARKRAR